MVSFLHEALVELLREKPELVALLLGRAGTLPAHDTLVVDPTSLGAPIASELRADGVVKFLRDGSVTLAAVIEVQLGRDPDKRFAWPDYASALRRRERSDVIVLVLAPERSTAAWAREPIPFGPGSGSFLPTVIGPDETPVIVDATRARQNPELAALSALVHGHDADVELAVSVALAATDAVLQLPGERGVLYYDLILASLGEAARRMFAMLSQSYEYQDEGLRKARSEGKAEGKAQGKAEGIVAVLEERGLRLEVDQRRRILECNDDSTLDRWLRAAVSCRTVEEIFSR